MKHILICLLLPIFFVVTSQHGFVPDRPNYNCFEKEPEPVDTEEAFEDYCKDYDGNIHYEYANLTSCCECIRYECVTLGELNEQKYFYWNKTISEHCCLHCDGTVYKADSVIESVVEEDECGTIKTSVCRKNDEGIANVEIDFAYKRCCNDEEGVLPIDTVKLEPSTCSERICEYSFSSQHSSWISRKFLEGCNCCVLRNGTMVPNGYSWTVSGVEYECCEGKIVTSVSDSTETIPPPINATILIVGGRPEPDANNSVQALDQDGNFLCDLPDVPRPFGRHRATMDGNILCGGKTDGGPESLINNCIFYQSGSWVAPSPTPQPLIEPRFFSVSWGRPNPPLNVDRSHIFGGINPTTFDPSTSSEIAFQIGSNPSYNYNGTIGQCSIQFENYVVLIGGTGASYETSVAVYDDSGFQYNLPNLQNKRTGHACGYYYKDGDLVYLVTGGLQSYPYSIHSSTELSVNEGAWSIASSGYLPTPLLGLKGVSLNNKVFVTGGRGKTNNGNINAFGNVLQWNIDAEHWTYLSSIKPRCFHSVSVLPWIEVAPYCL